MAYRVGLRGFVCISNPRCRAWLLAACLALCAGGGPAAAQAGLKVVPNFTYNWPDCPSSNQNCAKDAPLDVILDQMQLIAPTSSAASMKLRASRRCRPDGPRPGGELASMGLITDV